jgi:hypothetical protein
MPAVERDKSWADNGLACCIERASTYRSGLDRVVEIQHLRKTGYEIFVRYKEHGLEALTAANSGHCIRIPG